MNSEKAVFKGLKWLFSLLTGLMGIVIAALMAMAVVFNLPSMSHEWSVVSVKDLPFGSHTFDILSSPLFLLLLMVNFFMYGALFYFVRRFFHHLENDQIFVHTNVSTAKKIAFLLMVLSISSCLPDVYASILGHPLDSGAFDPTYLVGAAIVWALAKILEKANGIAEENELTI